MSKIKETCPRCNRLVRVRDGGRLVKHLAKLATPTTGATQCTNVIRGEAKL